MAAEQQAAAGAALMTPAGPAGTMVVLGTDDLKEVFSHRAEERTAPAETPDAGQRFPQAPGGDSSVCLGSEGAALPEARTSIAVRVPAGGATAVVLGCDDPAETFRERKKERAAAIETPDPVSRFQQAPGGTSSVHLGGDVAAEPVTSRGPIGGATTVVLGSSDPKEAYDLRQQCRDVVLDTPDAAPRFSQAPGGTSSLSSGAQPEGGPRTIVLGGSDDDIVDAVHVPRGAVGGPASVVLGDTSAREVFDQRREEREAAVETPAAPPRFQQTPGGTASIHLGPNGSADEAVASRGPVGGPATITLGIDSFKEIVDERRRQGEAEVMTPDAAMRFTQGPGGTSSICLGGAVESGSAATRGPVGGAVSVVLGDEDAAEAFNEHQKRRAAEVETPNAAPRFQQMPGGTASIRLGSIAEDAPEAPAITARGPVGGEATIVLGGDDSAETFRDLARDRQVCHETPDATPRFPQAPGGTATVYLGEASADGLTPGAPSVRGPVGGSATILLGGDDAAAAFSGYDQMRRVEVVTPEAALRHQQVPGGTSTIILGGSQAAVGTAATPRGPVGGEATLVLGGDDPLEAYQRYSAQHDVRVVTPEAAPRFQQAPGGTASISLRTDAAAAAGDAAAAVAAADRPVGGTATIVLGGDDPAEIFGARERERAADIETPEATKRFTQNPGGTTTIVLGGGFEAPGGTSTIVLGGSQAATTRGPVGGKATIVLGGDDPLEAYQCYSAQHDVRVVTPEAAPRFQQAPGGTASIRLCTDPAAAAGAAAAAAVAAADRPVGGTATLVLGGDDPADIFWARERERAADIETPEATRRFTQNPGGTTTIVLGGGFEARARPAGGQERQAPGGSSTIVLGGDSSDPLDTFCERGVSSNRFAQGSNQNCGNTITDRPTTRLHCAPGGASTVRLGGEPEAPATKVSSNAFAQGANQNCGNTITDRPTTKLHQAPGGTSTIVLGGDADDPFNTHGDKVAPAARGRKPPLLLGGA